MLIKEQTTMKAILKNGLIYPKEPVPKDWPEGAELEVARKKSRVAKRKKKSRIDQWMDRVEAQAAKIKAGSDDELDKAIQAVRLKNKELARKKAELE
jgi:hypothetical protein